MNGAIPFFWHKLIHVLHKCTLCMVSKFNIDIIFNKNIIQGIELIDSL